MRENSNLTRHFNSLILQLNLKAIKLGIAAMRQTKRHPDQRACIRNQLLLICDGSRCGFISSDVSPELTPSFFIIAIRIEFWYSRC
jgi:hypothetical protein